VGNFGNDATLDACMTGLSPSIPPPNLLCIAANTALVSERHGIAAVSLTSGRFRRLGEVGNLLYAWRILRRTPTLVIAGTGVLDDQHVRPSHLPLDVLRWSLAARLARAKLIFLSVGAGPIDHPLSRRYLKTAVALAHEVSYRDQRSMDFMRSIGRDVGNDRVLPDLALFHSPLDAAGTHTREGTVVVVGVLSRLNWQDRPDGYLRYETQLVDLIRDLATSGSKVLVVTGDEADVETQRAIMRRLDGYGPLVHAEQCHSFADVLEVVRESDVMIASRYHNLVAAVVAGVPVVSLGYGPKNDALLEQFDVPQWGHDIDTFSAEDVLEQVRDAMSWERPLFRTKLDDYRRELRNEFDRLIHA
jgi:polysaccharide pyruvyl transferase WcaK-like protein